MVYISILLEYILRQSGYVLLDTSSVRMDNSFDGREMIRCRVCRYGESLERFQRGWLGYRYSLALLDAAIGPEDHKVSVFLSYAFNELYLCFCMGGLDEREGVYLLASELTIPPLPSYSFIRRYMLAGEVWPTLLTPYLFAHVTMLRQLWCCGVSACFNVTFLRGISSKLWDAVMLLFPLHVPL